MTSELRRIVADIIDAARFTENDLPSGMYDSAVQAIERAILRDMKEVARKEELGIANLLDACFDSDYSPFEYPPAPLAERVAREMADYSFLLDAVPKVYMAVTGGRVSKPNTLPEAVIAEYEATYGPQTVDECIELLFELLDRDI